MKEDFTISTYKVFVKVNTDGCITQINSSAFIRDTTDWIKIDEGEGTKYHHAQNNYLDKPIIDENGIYNYKLVDRKSVLRSDEDKAAEIAKIQNQQKISKLKQQLSELDLQAVRPLRAIAAGTATDEDKSRLAEIESKAEALRAEIAELGEAVTK